MDDQDGIDIESLRVDPELMQRVLEQQAHKSKRKGWQRICTVLPREWELRLLEAKRISTYRLAIELLYLHWYGKGKPDHRFQQGGEGGKALRPIEMGTPLDELARLGLIEVDRKPRKSPRVVLLHTQVPKS